LACTGAGIYDRAIAALVKTGGVCNLSCNSQQVTEQRFILLCSIIKRVEMLARNNQQVSWRLRIDVTDNYRAIVFAYEFGGNFPVDNATE